VYRRRRVVAALAALLVLLGMLAVVRVAMSALGGVSASAPELRPPSAALSPAVHGGQVLVPGGTYVVQPGDTLWAIARALHPQGSLERTVFELEQLNGGPSIDVGQVVRLPG
jgi:Tfp pilus assembly protein FimV